MLHTYVQRFDVTRNLKKIYKILGTKQGPSHAPVRRTQRENTACRPYSIYVASSLRPMPDGIVVLWPVGLDDVGGAKK